MLWTTAFCASFVFVFLKAFQQLNVMHGQRLWVIPTSMAMAACELYVVALVAKNGYGWLVLISGTGAGLGCIAAMSIHKLTRKA